MGQPFDPNRQYSQQPLAGWQPTYPGSAEQHGGYPPPPQYQADSAASRPPRRAIPAFTGLVAGLLIAAIVGGILAVAGVLHFGSQSDEPARVSSAPLTLPSSLPGLQDLVTVTAAAQKKSSRSAESQAAFLAKQKANAEKVSSMTREAYQKANPGAAVAFAQYADSALERYVTVIAVRATYPGLTNGQVIDPAYLGLAVAQQRIESFGDVQCLLVQTESVRVGQTPDPKRQITTLCQRSGPALTVQIFAGGRYTGNEGRQAVVDLVNTTFATLAG